MKKVLNKWVEVFFVIMLIGLSILLSQSYKVVIINILFVLMLLGLTFILVKITNYYLRFIRILDQEIKALSDNPMNNLEEEIDFINESNKMDLNEFVEFGYLQEVNRLFFHPRGLALDVIKNNGQVVSFGGVWDYRDDPEGIYFDEAVLDPKKAANVIISLTNKIEGRMKSLGWVFQPIQNEELLADVYPTFLPEEND